MFAAILAFSLSISAEPPKLSEAGEKELKKLEAKWKATTVSLNGEDHTPDEDKGLVLEFKGRKVRGTANDKEMEFFEVDTLDATTNPKILDLKALVNEGPVMKGSVYEGIYKLDGDTLMLAIYIGEGKKRPEKFESPKDSAIVVLTMKREKK